MHPARKTAAVLLILSFSVGFCGVIYGAVTEGTTAIIGGWVILGLSAALLGAAAVALVVWRVRR